MPDKIMFNRSVRSPTKTKMPHRKNDAAPMIFFIDQIENSNFPTPILPMPMRIDRVLSKLPIVFVFPNERTVLSFQGKHYTFDYSRLYSYLITNLLKYTEQKYRTLFYKQLTFNLVEHWWEESKKLQSSIHSFSEDLTYILQSYLKAYIEYLSTENKNPKKTIIRHIDDIIAFCNERISSNIIEVDYKHNKKTKHIYKKKGGFIYPDIIEADIKNSVKGKVTQKAFVPMLLYDDLLECYLFNKKLIDPEGYEQLEDAKVPESNKKTFGIFSKFKRKKNEKSDKNDGTENETKDISIDSKENSQTPKDVTFEKIRELVIISETTDCKTKTINPEKILSDIDITKIFQEII